MSEKRKVALKIAAAILKDVRDRRGWRQEYEQFDDDVRREIKRSWIALIEKHLPTPKEPTP